MLDEVKEEISSNRADLSAKHIIRLIKDTAHIYLIPQLTPDTLARYNFSAFVLYPDEVTTYRCEVLPRQEVEYQVIFFQPQHIYTIFT